MCAVLLLLPTCEVRALVDVGQGVIVREAQLLVQVVPVPSLPVEEDTMWQYYHQLSKLENVASPRTMPPTQWKLPISIEELMEKKTIVLSAYVLCRISWQMRRLEKYFAKHIHHSQLPIFSTGTSRTK